MQGEQRTSCMPHVIVIEDDVLVRRLLERRLVDAGWRVTGLSDGRDLLERRLADPPDLVLVDLGLPYVDGLSVVEHLRARGLTVPILVLTAYDQPLLVDAVRSVGANGLVRKPYDQEDLLERMRVLLAA
ncbi:MAG: response regulator [Flavobacteriales bacterium]|nr:response regulator [Flavobacteriales bacterium]MCB9193560.1 response regulator [Flavobacteriales bacterium]